MEWNELTHKNLLQCPLYEERNTCSHLLKHFWSFSLCEKVSISNKICVGPLLGITSWHGSWYNTFLTAAGNRPRELVKHLSQLLATAMKVTERRASEQVRMKK